jgi:ABC-type amino acid transport substrate-binding protein
MPRLVVVFLLALFAPVAVCDTLAVGTETPALQLSDAEKAWLKEHPTFRVAGPRAFPPFHFVADGRMQGMAVDYLEVLATRLGIRLEYSPDLPWPEVLAGVREKRLDLIACAAKSVDREAYLSLTTPHLSFPLVIITRRDAPFVAGLNDLRGQRIALTKDIMTRNWLISDGLAFTPVDVSTLSEELEAVAGGRADAAVQNLAAASYVIEKRGLTNLKVAAPTPFGNYDLAIGVRKDWPELVELLNKALASIEQERHAAIRQKWMAVRYEFGLRWRDLLLWAGTVAAVAIAVITLIYRANRRLSREIAERLRVEGENRDLIGNLQHALAENRTLHGILPLCCHCKKIRTQEGAWEEVDVYIDKHSQADISHGICPDCLNIHYPEYQTWKTQSST